MDCPICFIGFESSGDLTPLTLDCGHSICQSCLRHLKIHLIMSCPLCKKKISETKIYSKNYSLMDMIEKMQPSLGSSDLDTVDSRGATANEELPAVNSPDIYDTDELQFDTLISFVSSPISPRMNVVKFVIDRSKVLGRFILYLEKTNTLLMTAKYVRNIFKPSEIVVSIGDNQGNDITIGKVVKKRTKFFSNKHEYKIKLAVPMCEKDSSDLEIGRIQHTSIYGEPRRSQVCFFNAHNNGKSSDKKMKNSLISMVNKGPTWDPRFEGYTLAFESRSSVIESIKNVQFVNPIDKSIILLQLGKLSENSFSLDCRGPLPPFAAFAIALSIIRD